MAEVPEAWEAQGPCSAQCRLPQTAWTPKSGMLGGVRAGVDKGVATKLA